MVLVAANALGIGAASFASGGDSGASKDIAESPTATPERHRKTTSQQDYKTTSFFS